MDLTLAASCLLTARDGIQTIGARYVMGHIARFSEGRRDRWHIVHSIAGVLLGFRIPLARELGVFRRRPARFLISAVHLGCASNHRDCP